MVTPENLASIQRLIEEDLRCWIRNGAYHFAKTFSLEDSCFTVKRETLEMLNNGGHRIISKIDHETYILFYEVLTLQESDIKFHEDAPTPTMVRK